VRQANNPRVLAQRSKKVYNLIRIESLKSQIKIDLTSFSLYRIASFCVYGLNKPQEAGHGWEKAIAIGL
jgi:hypothetical protein